VLDWQLRRGDVFVFCRETTVCDHILDPLDGRSVADYRRAGRPQFEPRQRGGIVLYEACGAMFFVRARVLGCHSAERAAEVLSRHVLAS